MKEALVIVESPTKAKTIGTILGKKGYLIVSSMGHVIDLPKSKLGVDIENNFQPSFIVIPRQKSLLKELKKKAAKKDAIYIATDPDREGEAIGWNIKEQLPKNHKFRRVIFHEITPEAIKEAFLKPQQFDPNMVEAQLARRILDRIVGYFLSPLLWRKIVRGLSAGRVQSVALRLIVEREREIQKFKPREYWEIEAELVKKGRFPRREDQFLAKLDKINDKKVEINNEQEAGTIENDLRHRVFKVADIKKTERKRHPPAPFTTSTLQQESFYRLRFTSKRTMIIAQQLYEGIKIGKDKHVGLITYMRTDSTSVASSAIKEVRNFILNNFGSDYLPSSPNVYKTKKLAQRAHEAIRPTKLEYSPGSIASYLTREQHKLYELIYNRFVASQMMPARYLQTQVSISADQYLFSASGTKLVFSGFSKVYPREENNSDKIPDLKKGETLNLLRLIPSQHFTKPPSRYSEASLVKVLEEDGIGRPSTYVPIINTLIMRDYARRQRGYFQATELGFKVCDLLVQYFPQVLNLKFTAQMEEELDKIEAGQYDRLKVLNDFYPPFKEHLDYAQKHVKKEVIFAGGNCKLCGKPMVVKWGRRGKFLSCSGFPKCKYSKSITTGVKCPEPNCGGELIERRSRRGVFYGCSNFPRCRFTSNKLPEKEDAALH